MIRQDVLSRFLLDIVASKTMEGSLYRSYLTDRLLDENLQ